MTKKAVEADPMIDPVDDLTAPEEVKDTVIWDHIHKLEAWARETHSTPFKHGITGPKSKVFAYYAPHDGEIEKHHMFTIDYEAAKKVSPDLWTLDEPEPGVGVVDKTRLRGWEPPEEKKPEEPEAVESKAGSTGPTW